MEKTNLVAGEYYKITETEVIYQNLAGNFKGEKRYLEDCVIAEKTNNKILSRDLEEYKRRENKIDTYFFLSSIFSVEDGVLVRKDDDSEYRNENGVLVEYLENLVYNSYDAFLNPIDPERFVNNFTLLNEDEILWFDAVVKEEASFQLALNDEQIERDLKNSSLCED